MQQQGDVPLGHNVSLISSIGTTNRLAAACLEDCDMNRPAAAVVTVAEIALCALNIFFTFMVELKLARRRGSHPYQRRN